MNERRIVSVKRAGWWVLIAGVTFPSGCGSRDERVVQVATEAAERQAAQNQQMAGLQEQVASGTKELVAAESQARREWVELQHDVERTLSHVGQQRDALEAERRTWADQRARDPIFAAALKQLGWVLAICVTLVTAAYLYIRARHPPEEIIRARVVRELLAQQPGLLLTNETPAPKPKEDSE